MKRAMLPTLNLSLNKKGQAAIEAVFASMGILTFCLLLLTFLYFCSLSTHLNFSSHEFLICRETSEPILCEAKLRKEIRGILRFGALEMLHARKAADRQEVRIRFRFHLLNLHTVLLEYEDQLRLPLAIK